MSSLVKVIFFIGVFCCGTAHGKNIQFVTYGNEEGLPSNLTKAIIQDATGFIWIGSDAGLARFDGKNFMTFTDRLPSPYVKQLFVDRAQRLLIVTDMGISAATGMGSTRQFSTLLAAAPQLTDTTLFYPKGVFETHDGALWISEPDAVVKFEKGRLHRYPFAEKYRADSYARSFQCIEDKDGVLFVLSERGYLFRYDSARDTFELCTDEQAGKPFLIDAVVSDASGTLIIGGSKGIYELQIHSGTRSYSLTQLSPLPGVSSLVRGNDGSIFAGTWLSGVYRLEKKTGSRAEPLSALPMRVVNGLALGRDNEIWVSSDEGIALVSDTYFAPVPLPLSNFYIEAIAESPDGTILVTDGRAVFRIDEQNDVLRKKKIFSGTESLIVSLATDGETVWIGYRDGFLTELTASGAKKHIVPSGGNRLLDHLSIDTKHNLWICQDGLAGIYKLSPGRVIKFYGAPKGITSHISVVREIAPGTIVCAGDGVSSYLYQYDEERDLFVNISLPLPEHTTEFVVNDLAVMSNGHLWLGTSGGLLRFGNGIVTRPVGYELFANEVIKSIAIDSAENIWLGTDRGVLRYAEGQVSRFDGRDGLTSMIMAYRACLIDKAQKVWLGTAHGVSRWNLPRNITGVTPSPLFISIDVNGKKIADPASAPVEYDYNSYFSAVTASLTYPSEKILYRYRVKELSAAWSTPSSSSSVVVPQFREGHYTIEISAQQPGYLWSEPATMIFAVAPPFYRTWWAYCLYAVLIGMGIAAVVKFRIEANERKKLQTALSDSENNLRSLFNTMHDVYFQSDMKGTIIDIAPSIFIHSGYTREELIGADSAPLYMDTTARKDMVTDLLRIGETLDHEILLKTKNGLGVWVSMNAQLIKDERGKVVGFRGVMREITSRKKLEDDLRNNLKRERELNELKSRFVSMVSHEFRTPLASILSSTELLERYGKKWDDQKAEKARTHYARIQDAIKRMTQLLEDVLIIGKADAGKLEFVPRPMRLEQFCRRIVDEMQSTLDAGHKGIRFLPTIADRELLFDEKLLRHVITNILSNAVKYSPQGGLVTFTLHEQDHHVVFAVQDQGIGIPEQELDHLFESFHRAGNVGSIPGTGLGLSIVKRCVDLHEGTIDVVSSEGEGTTFTVSLPLAHQ